VLQEWKYEASLLLKMKVEAVEMGTQIAVFRYLFLDLLELASLWRAAIGRQSTE
jgi:hypothetical protein